MALMSSIRTNLAKLFGVLAVFFILTIIFDWGFDLTDRRSRQGANAEVLGEVNGKEINYRQFTELVRRTIENQKKQQNVEIDDETERQIRSQVWTQMVDEMLIDEEIERLGITVSDQEIRDIVMGPNPPEFLVQQFRDSTGTFRRDAYQQAMMDPQNKNAWIQVEEMIRAEQKRKKLQSLLISTVVISESELKQRFINQNISMTADYVLFDVNRLVPDSAVTITDDDLRRQYELHPEEFQAKASRKIKYVQFSQSPSADDTATVLTEAQRLLEQVKTGVADYTELAKTYSEIPSAETFFKHGELSQKKEDMVFSAKKGEVVGPIIDYDGIHLMKVLEHKQGTTEYVKASHILLNLVTGPDSTQVIKKARELLAKARSGADFARLARENSQDYGSATQGGELRWTTKDGWVKPFADAAFKARIGEIVGPVRTQFGWHIIKVTGKDKREIKVSDLALKIRASSQTFETAFQNAQDFGILAQDEGFEKAAENSRIEVRETPEFTKTGTIPGIGQNDALTNFAFNNKLGSISEPLYIRNAVVVAKVSNIREDGIRPFDEVKNSVRPMALKQMKLEKIHPQVDVFYNSLNPSSDLLSAGQSVPNIIAQSTSAFKPTDVPQGVGRDPVFIGTALALKPGEISKPVEGSRGYFIIKMVSKTEFDSTKYRMEEDGLRRQLLSEKNQRNINEWQLALREKADIIDHRDKFFR
jgi:parvulin-like peptidyl-prolyl isomerase